MELSWCAVETLKCVDTWIGMINSNINGSVRTGYKTSKPNFGGGTTNIQRLPEESIIGIQFPEQEVKLKSTSVDFSQGSIINSTEETHFAIQGKGFFLVQALDGTDLGGCSGSDTIIGTFSGSGVGQKPAYLTRDGEFHWGILPNDPNKNIILLTNDGLAVLSDHGDSNNVYGPIGKTNWDNDSSVNPVYYRVRPSVVQTSVSDDQLTFSKYGSTVFESKGTITTLVEGAAGKMSSDTSTLVEQSLETSNSNISSSVPELSLSQKFFQAVSKVLQIGLQNTDTLLNLIR